MTKSMAELADELRTRVIELDGLGDFGTARAESVRRLTHDVLEIVEEFRRFEGGLAGLMVHWNDVLTRLDRLERVYLPDSATTQ